MIEDPMQNALKATKLNQKGGIFIMADKMEAISIDTKVHVDRSTLPHFNFAKMEGNHMIDAEFYFNRVIAPEEEYHKNSIMIDEYKKD